jgi:uncharacterized protein with PIN domain
MAGKDRVLIMSEDAGEDAGQRFLVDLMLMRLGRWLRLLGQDVANPEGGRDDGLRHQAKKECRTIITRDRGLFRSATGAGISCLLIQSSKISDQLQEMAKAGVPLQLDPRRCTLCNGRLQEVEMPGMKRWQCSNCKKIYWVGGHWQKMESMLQGICIREENALPFDNRR